MFLKTVYKWYHNVTHTLPQALSVRASSIKSINRFYVKKKWGPKHPFSLECYPVTTLKPISIVIVLKR